MKAIGFVSGSNSTHCRLWITSLTTTFALACQVVAAVENVKSDKVAEKSDRAALIDITIETSRSQPTAGDGLGVTAEIRNVSDSVIHLESKEIDLVIPPELEGPGKAMSRWYAEFPTETYPTTGDIWAAGVDLKPGDSYKVYWTQGIKYTAGDQEWYIGKIYNVIVSEMNFIFFPPGDYKIAIVCKYRPINSSELDPKTAAYRTTSQAAIIHVAAPQFVILFGAALGGLLAYFLLPQGRKKLVQTSSEEESLVGRIVTRIIKEVAGIAGAVLLSTMITILLSRISETQFLIKVTITDVWGAIAIGFIANYLGAKALDKILTNFGEAEGKSRAAAAKAEPR